VGVCRLLLDLGVLMRVAGDEEGYVNQSGDVLYDVHRRVLARLPAGTRGASLIAMTHSDLGFNDRLAALLDEYVPDGPDGRRMALRHRLARRLLDDPVVYHDELTEEELEYLVSQRGPLAYRLAQATGLTAELRAEGLALMDGDGELTDQHLPAVGTEAHATLLVAEHLARTARIAPERIHSLHELSGYLRTAADRYGRFWRKDAREAGAEVALATEAVSRLVALRLVRRLEHGVQALPALHRYAIAEPLT
jgi:uncharacterized protein (TIGR02678 family)